MATVSIQYVLIASSSYNREIIEIENVTVSFFLNSG